jgi:hypothetical protein
MSEPFSLFNLRRLNRCRRAPAEYQSYDQEQNDRTQDGHYPTGSIILTAPQSPSDEGADQGSEDSQNSGQEPSQSTRWKPLTPRQYQPSQNTNDQSYY